MLKKFLLCFVFFLLSPLILAMGFYLTDSSSRLLPWLAKGNAQAQEKVLGAVTKSFSSEALAEVGLIESSIKTENSLPLIIENYLRHYNSPLLPYKDKILEEAAFHKVNPELIVAIAQQESNLGKKSPENCFNAWGWAIHERGTKCFDDWNNAIETVTAGIASGYCEKGLCDDPCEMMKKYTPKSNGSWCLAVKQFLGEMETGNF